MIIYVLLLLLNVTEELEENGQGNVLPREKVKEIEQVFALFDKVLIIPPLIHSSSSLAHIHPSIHLYPSLSLLLLL